jgi:hypothetical protein
VKYRIGAEEARAPRAICGYFSRNQEASTTRTSWNQKKKFKANQQRVENKFVIK